LPWHGLDASQLHAAGNPKTLKKLHYSTSAQERILVSIQAIYLRTAAVSNVSTRIRKTYPTHPKKHAYRRNNYSTSTDSVSQTVVSSIKLY